MSLSYLPLRSSSTVTLKFQKEVSSSYEELYLEGRFTDVKIIVGGSEFNAHKLILASQSLFFEAMFYNTQMLESRSSEVTLKETDSEIFALLLKIVYGGRLEEAEKISADMLVRLYILLERYQFVKFETRLLAQIGKKLMCNSNFWQFLDVAVYYDVSLVLELCFAYLESLAQSASNAVANLNSIALFEKQAALFNSANFVNISHETLKVLLDRNITCSEVRLLEATQKWIDHNAASLTSNEKLLLMKRIRLNIMSEYDLVTYVKLNDIEYSDLYDALQLIQNRYDNIIDFYILTHYGVQKGSFEYHEMKRKASQEIIKNRAFHIANYNVCQEDFGFVISNTDHSHNQFFLDQLEWTPSDTNDQKPGKITICLGFPFLLNVIDMNLSEQKGDKFSYIIEYSADGFNWNVLYDYRQYLCSNHQVLYFNPIVARYFRLKGFHQVRLDERTRKPFRSVKSFKALYNQLNAAVDVRTCEGIISNVFYTCQVKHRVYCDNSGTLANEDRYYSMKYVGNSKELVSPNGRSHGEADFNGGGSGSGFKSVIVLFDQPIVLSSFTFRLFDHDDALAYSYKVDIFDFDSGSWEAVEDRSTEKCSSWQKIVFSSRPVNLLRIVPIAVHNSPVQEFRILKFNFNAKV